ncbi:MAG TPA: tRNA (adenosine(37)-N6)-threonylcarbamoyltransferase complex dimerization subunit type 1 TsaB [Acidimicrobiales bacterium]|nr:tRNA (adenosine(37)-N6)-threonylcarbamoyltransferase complex dimerization subunit type 1 TsaB [Acidimicrobiales bacterium]
MSEPLTLAIDTATSQVAVAVGRPGEPIAAIAVDLGRRHAELLAPSIQTILRLASVHIREIERIVVDNGPGLFTGLRVGIATAKALASALGIQVVPCSSLDILAYVHRLHGRTVAAVVDAKRGEVFWSLYVPDGDSSAAEGMVPTTDARVTDPAELVEAAKSASENGPLIVTGDGARRYADLLSSVDGIVLDGPEHDHPSATALLELSASRAALCPDKVVAEYLRGPDVRIGWEQRHE